MICRLRSATAAEGRIDVVIDPLFGEPFVAAVNAASFGARLVQIGAGAGAEATIPSAPIRGKMLVLMGHTNFAAPPEVKREAYGTAGRGRGARRDRGGRRRIPLEQVAEAWERLARGLAPQARARALSPALRAQLLRTARTALRRAPAACSARARDPAGAPAAGWTRGSASTAAPPRSRGLRRAACTCASTRSSTSGTCARWPERASIRLASAPSRAARKRFSAITSGRSIAGSAPEPSGRLQPDQALHERGQRGRVGDGASARP